MTQGPRRQLTDRALGKTVVLAVLSVLAAALLHADAGAQDPFFVRLIAAAVLLFGAFGIYELAGWGLGRLLARTRLSAERRAHWSADQDARKGPFRARQALTLLAAYVAAHAAVWVPIVAFSVGEDGQVDTNRLQPFLALGILLSFLVAGLVALFVFRRYSSRCRTAGVDLTRAIGARASSLLPMLLAMISGFALGTGILFLSVHTPVREDFTPGILARAAETPGVAQFAWVFAALILAPPIEEFVFRGAVFEGLRRSWGSLIAGLFVTALFVGMHVPEVSHHWPALLGVTVAGVALLLARMWSDSLAPAIALHCAYNFVPAAAIVGSTVLSQGSV